MAKTSSKTSRDMLAGLISAELNPQFDPTVLRALVEEGKKQGYEMKEEYEKRRKLAKEARGVEAPTYEELMLLEPPVFENEPTSTPR